MSTFFQQTAQAMIAKHIDRFPLLKLDQVIDWQPIEQYLNRQKTRYLRDHRGRPALQAFNQRHLGILRNDACLRRAIAQLRLWKQNQAEPHTASEYENRNLLECSLAVAQAAYARRQNIGAHFNTDLAACFNWQEREAG